MKIFLRNAEKRWSFCDSKCFAKIAKKTENNFKNSTYVCPIYDFGTFWDGLIIVHQIISNSAFRHARFIKEAVQLWENVCIHCFQVLQKKSKLRNEDQKSSEKFPSLQDWKQLCVMYDVYHLERLMCAKSMHVK